ncbi:MAG: MIP/aquaporin family protein [Pseudomonadota bacterium]
MSEPLARQLASEALGTLLLVATVVGSGIMAETLAGGNFAVALLGNTIATGAILYVLITMLGPVSGAHFNPAVTLAFLLRKEIAVPAAVAFVIVQCAGSIVGSILAHAMFEQPLLQLSLRERTGGAQWLSEGVATFALVLTILGTLRARPQAVPAAVALVITAGYWFTASTSFANPAVTLGRMFSDTFSGIAPIDAPGFMLAQLAGAVLAWAVANFVFGWRGESPLEASAEVKNGP